jgi:hypothetical protein
MHEGSSPGGAARRRAVLLFVHAPVAPVYRTDLEHAQRTSSMLACSNTRPARSRPRRRAAACPRDGSMRACSTPALRYRAILAARVPPREGRASPSVPLRGPKPPSAHGSTRHSPCNLRLSNKEGQRKRRVQHATTRVMACHARCTLCRRAAAVLVTGHCCIRSGGAAPSPSQQRPTASGSHIRVVRTSESFSLALPRE